MVSSIAIIVCPSAEIPHAEGFLSVISMPWPVRYVFRSINPRVAVQMQATFVLVAISKRAPATIVPSPLRLKECKCLIAAGSSTIPVALDHRNGRIVVTKADVSE